MKGHSKEKPGIERSLVLSPPSALASIDEMVISNIHNLIDSIHQKAINDFSEHLKNYLIANLKELGHEFKNDIEFIEFCKKRITRNQTNEYNKNEHLLFLDYKSKDEPGYLVGIYSDEINFNQNNGTFTITFG